MKYFVIFSAVLSLAVARPDFLSTVVPISQYHSQDNLGQYAYGYSAGLSAKNEYRALDGTTHGAYSYIDSEGKVQSVSYIADAINGFRVAGTNIPIAPGALAQEVPKPVEDTPEVANAKAEHAATVEAIKLRNAAIEASDPGDNSVEVPQTAIPQVYSYAAPGLHYVQPYSAYYHHVPSFYSYQFPYIYAGGHVAGELPREDEAVAKARSEHLAAHQQVKARLAAAGAEV